MIYARVTSPCFLTSAPARLHSVRVVEPGSGTLSIHDATCFQDASAANLVRLVVEAVHGQTIEVNRSVSHGILINTVPLGGTFTVEYS